MNFLARIRNTILNVLYLHVKDALLPERGVVIEPELSVRGVDLIKDRILIKVILVPFYFQRSQKKL